MRFHKTNHISQNFSGITLGFHKITKYFVDFQFLFQYFQKITAKILVLFEQIQNFEVLNLTWVKVKKVNIAIT
jgi:hypothetical protein